MSIGEKAFGLLEKFLMGPMGKISSLRFVRAIMAGGIAVIPFIIVGSMFLVLNILPQTLPFLEGFFDNTFFRISDLYMLANKATMGILALFFGLVVGYEYTKIISEEEGINLSPLNGALLSMFAFFLTIPQLVWKNGEISLIEKMTDDQTIVSGWEVAGSGLSRLGATGVFTAIITAIITVQLYKMCVKRNWVIKMPEQVPEGVSRSFTALIPAFVVAIVILIINGVLVALGTDIFKMIEYPFGFVVNLTHSWLGVMVILFIIHALWIVGIHGSSIITGLLTPIWLTNMEANINGANIPFAGEFQNAFAVMGGAGATLGLCIFIAFFARSKQLTILGKAALAPSIFNINEPLIFGLPIIYNPFLAIPFFLAPMVSGSIGYLAIKLNIVQAVVAFMPWPSPAGAGAFISTGGDYMAVVVALLSVVVAFLIWYPFIRIYDKRLLNEENAEEPSA